LRTDARVVRRHSKADTIVTGLSVLAFADERVWLSLLVQFACIYGEIHEALVRAAETNEAIRLLLQHRFKITDRREAFARDVRFFQKRVTQTPTDAHARVHAETLRYVAHIRETCEKEPVLAVVFAHTMLMALMAGGAILRRMQRASMGLPRYVVGQPGDDGDGDGSEIFSFERAIGTPSAVRKFKTGLDVEMDHALPLWREPMSGDCAKAEPCLPITHTLFESMVETKAGIFAWNNRCICSVVLRAPPSAFLSLLAVSARAARRGDAKTSAYALAIFCAFLIAVLAPLLFAHWLLRGIMPSAFHFPNSWWRVVERDAT